MVQARHPADYRAKVSDTESASMRQSLAFGPNYKAETVYVVAGSDAEAHVAHRFPAKRTTQVGNGVRVRTVDAFAVGLPLIFQREASAGLAATYHFSFTGSETRSLTITIHDKTLDVSEGHHERPDLRIRADTTTWFAFLAGERSIAVALARGKIRLRGSARLLITFARCLPS